MTPHWYDRAEQEIESAYEKGEISSAEYRQQMRDLNDELRGSAEEAAEQAYNDTMGGW